MDAAGHFELVLPTVQRFEVTVFSETLERSRDHLETGARVVLTVEATLEEDQLKLLARAIQPADDYVEDAGGAGLRIFVEDAAVLPSVATVLKDAADVKGGRGPIAFCLLDTSLPGEVEIAAAGEFPVSPQIKGALKSLGGVVTVEEM